MTSAAFSIDVHLEPDDLAEALRADARRGLTATPKLLPSKWFYDAEGSRLFDEITRLPEYYPTRREREILLARADDIAVYAKADTIVELGSGTSEKTRILLDAFNARGTLHRFVPFDVSESTLISAGATIAADYPGVAVHAVVGDFERHLHTLPREGVRVVAFLGGTIGNLVPEERAAFFAALADAMTPGESLLLGTDLVKDVARIEAAYNDSQGVTAAFNRNVLAVLNRELGASFVLDGFAHVAFFDRGHEWIEMRLRSLDDQVVDIPGITTRVAFAAGEDLRTEISAKFRRPGVERELAAAGFELAEWWTDRHGDFALSLSVRR
jgi:L-histidine N-alpha-methyltransferase